MIPCTLCLYSLCLLGYYLSTGVSWWWISINVGGRVILWGGIPLSGVIYTPSGTTSSTSPLMLALTTDAISLIGGHTFGNLSYRTIYLLAFICIYLTHL